MSRELVDNLLAQPDGHAILEDLMREHGAAGTLRRHVSAAHVAWERTEALAPTDPDRTLYVVDRFTTFESYPPHPVLTSYYDERCVKRYGEWVYWWNVTRQHLPIHPGARWIRVVKADGGYRPKPHETILVRRKRRGADFYVDVRCGVATCACRGTLFGLVSR